MNLSPRHRPEFSEQLIYRHAGRLIPDKFTRINRKHGITRMYYRIYVCCGFQVISVCSEAVRVALPECGAAGCIQHLFCSTACSLELPDRLLGEHRPEFRFPDRFQVRRPGISQPVAQSEGVCFTNQHRPGKWKLLPELPAVFIS